MKLKSHAQAALQVKDLYASLYVYECHNSAVSFCDFSSLNDTVHDILLLRLNVHTVKGPHHKCTVKFLKKELPLQPPPTTK